MLILCKSNVFLVINADTKKIIMLVAKISITYSNANHFITIFILAYVSYTNTGKV